MSAVNQTSSALHQLVSTFTLGISTIELFTILAISAILGVYVVEKVVARTGNNGQSQVGQAAQK
ncbi:MAG: hypothetical protein QW429_05615 [Thermoprotei archaeon]